MGQARTSLHWAVLVAVSLVIAGCSGDGTAAGPEGERAEPAAHPESTEPTPPGGWIPLRDDADDSPMPAGRYGMAANGRPEAPWAVFRFPDGFSNIAGWAMFDERSPGEPGMGYWTVSEVDRNPCRDVEGDPMDAGTTVEDLVATLARQRQTIRTRPVPTVLDGHEGLYLEIRVPDIDVTDCVNAEYFVWESDPAGARHMESAGVVDRLWIVDVDGQVVVIDTTASPDVPRRAFDRMSEIVKSVEFVDWPG